MTASQRVFTGDQKGVQYQFKLLCMEKMGETVDKLVEVAIKKGNKDSNESLFKLYGLDILLWIKESFEDAMKDHYDFDK